MNDNETSRLSRLTAIITQLQTKRLITSTVLAKHFNVSVRTIYRDIRSLEESGIPIVTEEGKGYTLMEGYRLPPVMFTESEANALITAEQIVLKNKDASFVKEYTAAIQKIKSVLKQESKEHADLLSNRMAITLNHESDISSNYLSVLQLALTNFSLTVIDYQTADSDEITTRTIEPFALLSTQGNWLLVAWCRLRKGFRLFRLDRIRNLTMGQEKFEPHKMTLQEYFDRQKW
jgi:predicted DNA-binding transcriptional regulator YafY